MNIHPPPPINALVSALIVQKTTLPLIYQAGNATVVSEQSWALRYQIFGAI